MAERKKEQNNVSKLVSIIMPAYNSEKFIADSIQSVLNQTYEKWELIIVDDCSTDNTAKVVNRFSDSRIHYYKCDKNIGVSGARNFGISKASGKWVAFLDSDDLWEAVKLKKQMDFIEKNSDAKLVFTASSFINKSGEPFSYIFPAREKVTSKELLKQNVLSCSSILVLKECIARYPFPSGELIHEDYVSWLRILDDIKIAYGINEPLLVYRVTSDSKTGNKLRAAKMQWNAYKAYGLGFVKRVYYMGCYLINGLKKYKNLL